MNNLKATESKESVLDFLYYNQIVKSNNGTIALQVTQTKIDLSNINLNGLNLDSKKLININIKGSTLVNAIVEGHICKEGSIFKNNLKTDCL